MYPVLLENMIRREDRTAFDDSLSDEHTVKRVLVAPGKAGESLTMSNGEGQFLESCGEDCASKRFRQ